MECAWSEQSGAAGAMTQARFNMNRVSATAQTPCLRAGKSAGMTAFLIASQATSDLVSGGSRIFASKTTKIFPESCHEMLKVVRDSERMSSGMTLLLPVCRYFAVEIACLFLISPHPLAPIYPLSLRFGRKEKTRRTVIATVQVARIQVGARIQVASDNSRASSWSNNTRSTEYTRDC